MTELPPRTQVLIVGGGLAGLSLATKLHAAGVDFQLAEARSRFGGRIHSPRLCADGAADGAVFDVGPSWFWPGQARMEALTKALGAEVFEQWDEGQLVFEDERGNVQRADFSPMAGSLRVDGGMGELIDGLVTKLPAERLHLAHSVSALERTEAAHVIANIDARGRIECEHVVLALPPRVAASLQFSPALDEGVMAAMRAVPTWMAGHAKVLALYERPFWRERGLSGDGMSRRGPLVEIHDASPRQGGPYALFGFVGASVQQRSDPAFLDAVRAQLVRLFGEEAGAAIAVHLQDWALETRTSTLLDRQALQGHPDYGKPVALRDVWSCTLHFASSEMAPEFGGYLEGALGAAEAVAERLVKATPS